MPMAMRRTDVVTNASHLLEPLEAAASKWDELMGLHHPHASARPPAFDDERPQADVLDARREHEPRVELPWRTAPADRDGERRPLVEVGQKRFGERARSASGANSGRGQHADESDPGSHRFLSTHWFPP